MRELKKFILEKNKSLKPTGQKICVNVKTAYQTNMVPITTTSNLLQDEILTHLVFDTGKAMKSSPLLRPFCVSEFWGFSLLNI